MDNYIEYGKILKNLEEIDNKIEELLSNYWVITDKDDNCYIFFNGEERRIITADYINALFE